MKYLSQSLKLFLTIIMLAMPFVIPLTTVASDVTSDYSYEGVEAEVLYDVTDYATDEWLAEEDELEAPFIEYDMELADLLPLNVTTTSQIGYSVMITGGAFRVGPGTAFASMRTLTPGTELEVLGSTVDGRWLNVRIGNQVGFAFADSVRQTTRVGVMIAGGAFRVGPGTAHASMRTLTQGTELEILGASADGRWLRVRNGNQLGWAFADSVRQTTRLSVMRAGGAFRVGPGTGHTSMRTLTQGTEIEVLGSSTDGRWLRVRSGTQVGWAFSDSVTQAVRLGVMTVGGAFRVGPGTGHVSMRTLTQGTQLEILGSSADGRWLRVRVGNQLGFAFADSVIRTLPHHQAVETTLRSMVAGRSNIGISYLCLTTGRHISINGNRNFNAASTIKLPTHMLVAEAVRDGRLSWSQRLTVTQADWLGGSGVLQHRVRVGQQLTLYEVMRHSIVYSDNLAHRMLTRTVIPGFVHDPTGLDNSRRQLTNAIFARYLPGQSVAGRSVITPNQLTEVLRVLYQDRSAISGYGTIINYMRNSSWNNRFNTNLARRHVAHTPGWTGTYSHDSGIFFTDYPYVLVVMTTGVGGANFISEVGDAIFRLHR